MYELEQLYICPVSVYTKNESCIYSIDGTEDHECYQQLTMFNSISTCFANIYRPCNGRTNYIFGQWYNVPRQTVLWHSVLGQFVQTMSRCNISDTIFLFGSHLAHMSRWTIQPSNSFTPGKHIWFIMQKSSIQCKQIHTNHLNHALRGLIVPRT